jgi:hypothetical protein
MYAEARIVGKSEHCSKPVQLKNAESGARLPD